MGLGVKVGVGFMVKVGVEVGGSLVGVKVGRGAQVASRQPLGQFFIMFQHSPSQRY